MSEYRLKIYNGAWCAVWREGGTTHRRSLRVGTDRAKAERQFADFVKKRAVSGDTVEDIMGSYLKDKEHIASIKTAKQAWGRNLKPFFGNLLPEHIDRNLCRKYTKERLDTGVSNWTVRRELGVLRSALYWRDKRSPAVFELPAEGKPRSRSLSREEFDKLVDSTVRPHVRLFILLAGYTAGRMGAILDLTWDRVNFERRTITLANGQHKIKGRAVVPVTDKLMEPLKAAYEARTSRYVIEHGGEKIKSIKKGVAEAARRAGLQNVSAHVLRHTSAVWMAEGGVPMEEIAQFMGHTDSRITFKHYAHYSPSYLAKAAKILGGK